MKNIFGEKIDSDETCLLPFSPPCRGENGGGRRLLTGDDGWWGEAWERETRVIRHIQTGGGDVTELKSASLFFHTSWFEVQLCNSRTQNLVWAFNCPVWLVWALSQNSKHSEPKRGITWTSAGIKATRTWRHSIKAYFMITGSKRACCTVKMIQQVTVLELNWAWKTVKAGQLGTEGGETVMFQHGATCSSLNAHLRCRTDRTVLTAAGTQGDDEQEGCALAPGLSPSRVLFHGLALGHAGSCCLGWTEICSCTGWRADAAAPELWPRQVVLL